MKVRLVATLLCCLVTGGAQATMPAAFSAVYRVERSGVKVGELTMALSRNGASWRFETRMAATGLFALLGGPQASETSVMEFSQGELRPLTYAFDAGSARRSVMSYFDWSGGRMLSSFGDKALEVSLDAGAFDRLSVLLAIGAQLREGTQHWQVPVAEKGRIRETEYRREGTETVRTGVGEVESVRVREVRAPGKRHTIGWFAPALHYLPARLDQFKDGKRVGRIVLHRLRWVGR